jgi:RNA polymerase sigma factor (sigma-70 family)
MEMREKHPTPPAWEVTGGHLAVELQPSDIAAINRAKFLRYIRLHESQLRLYAQRQTGSVEAGFDIVQELCRRTVKRDLCAKLYENDHIKASVLHSIRNLATDWLRKHGRIITTPNPYEHQNATDQVCRCIEDILVAEPEGAEWAARFREQLEPYLVQLTRRQGEVMRLTLANLKMKEIAAKLGIKVDTVKKHKRRAVNALKTILRSRAGGVSHE